MNVLVLNGSPKGKDSITLQTVLYLEKRFPLHAFSVLHVGQRIRALEKDFSEAKSALENADLLLFCYPVYTFLVPSQLHRFLELIQEHNVPLSGKYAAQLSTSLHFYDITAHAFLRDVCADLGLRYVEGLSAGMDDLLNERGRAEAEAFFRHVLWSIESGMIEPSSPAPAPRPTVPAHPAPSADKLPGKAAIVADFDPDKPGALGAMIDRFQAVLPMETDVVNLRTFPFAGGCLGCFRCAADGTCVYRDGFDSFLRDRIQTADAIVYAYSVRDHSMGSRFKQFDDRQFCNGHRTVTMGKPVGYLVDGALSCETNLTLLMETRAQVGGNYLAGIASNETDPDGAIDRLAKNLRYAIETDYQPPKNFYGVGGMKIFRDLIYEMQGLMREDHRFYKAHGFYDFPQKHKGRIVGMYLVGAMTRSKALQKKIGGRMTEGMLMPYRKVLDDLAKKD